MGIDSNKEAYQMMKNTLGSIENRFREAYNKGYKDGLRDGASQVTAKLVSKILEETEADTPQKKDEIVLDPSFAELSDEQFVKAMKLIEPQTDCIIADAKLKAHCLNCAESGSYKCTKCDGEMYYKDTPQTETKEVRYCNECKWFRNKQVCGRCRSLNLFAKADTPQTDVYDYKGNGKWERSE